MVRKRFDDGPQQLRLRIAISGLIHGRWSPRRGDVIDVPDLRTAARYLAAGYAQPVWEHKLGDPYSPWKK